MKTYEFTLKFDLQNKDADPEQYVEALGGQGCDDALIGFGKFGSIALTFDRDAETAHAAISSAISDIKAVIPKARLCEAGPDLVGLSDIAKAIQCSRQNVRKLLVTAENAPRPVHGGNPALWHLADVLKWLKVEKNYEIDETMLAVAELMMPLNALKSINRTCSETKEEAMQLVQLAAA